MASPKFIILSLFAFLFGATCYAQGPVVPKAQVVLFTPSDVTAPSPDVYLPRLHDFGLYAEVFFNKGLRDWGHHPKRKEIFERDQNGKITVIHVKGDLKAAGDEYKKQWISRQVLGKLRSEHKITTAGNLFWIFVYLGDPPAKHSNYRGSGNSRDGGWAVLNYTNLPGKVDLAQDAVSSFHDRLFLKGCIHEFGHALGLPHIGPKTELGKGNTLMGPITRIYAYHKKPDRTKAYLSEASAAILSAHPVFTGDPTLRRKLPQTSFADLKADYDQRANGVSVTGQINANHDVHRIIVVDDANDKIGGYWVKAFVAKPGPQGKFAVSIPRPQKCSGKMKVLAVHTNGAFTGNGQKHGIESASLLSYSFP